MSYRQREGGMILLTPELRGRLQRIIGRKASPAWVVSASAWHHGFARMEARVKTRA
jgi:hypothetical protein